VRLAGLRDDRRPVIGGGVSVLRALMNLLQIDALHVAEGALRNGVLFEMLHRDEHLSDARDTSIRRLAHKFHIDQGQSQRVANVALFFLHQTVSPAAPQVDHLRRKLMWASQLHEVGMAISHSDYHKHGAYILDNADMLGFSLPELHRLSLLVLGHRGKLKKLDTDIEDETFAHVLLALRLACILCHARTDVDPSGFTLTYQPNKQVFKLRVNALWTEQHPQSTHLLQQECLAWSKTDWRLNFSAI
jgi:exopolyphosphatase / guanosine-5'-triphosphate,3'-diphosphate pyrophosphatase